MGCNAKSLVAFVMNKHSQNRMLLTVAGIRGCMVFQAVMSPMKLVLISVWPIQE